MDRKLLEGFSWKKLFLGLVRHKSAAMLLLLLFCPAAAKSCLTKVVFF
jgi:hypothetical protein